MLKRSLPIGARGLALMALSLLLVACAAPAPTATPTRPAALSTPTKAVATPTKAPATPGPSPTPGKMSKMPDGFPARELHFVVHTGPGGSTDQEMRALAKAVEPFSPVPIVVENRVDPLSSFGMHKYFETVTGGKEGYYLASLSGGTMSRAYTVDTGGVKMSDLKPVISMSAGALCWGVLTGSQWQTMPEMIQYMKANPGRVRASGGAAGTIAQVVAHWLANEAGFRFTYVPTGGTGEAVQLMLGEGSEVAFSTCPSLAGQVEAGKARILAVSSPERVKSLPNVPTFKELGYPVEFTQFRGYFTRPEVSDARVQWLHDLFKIGLEQPVFQDFVQKAGDEVFYLGPKDFGDFVNRVGTAYEKVVRDLGLHVEQQ